MAKVDLSALTEKSQEATRKQTLTRDSHAVCGLYCKSCMHMKTKDPVPQGAQKVMVY